MTYGITCSEKTNSVAYNFMEVSNGMHIVIRCADGKCNISEMEAVSAEI